MHITRTQRVLFTLYLLEQEDLSIEKIIKKHAGYGMGKISKYSVISCINSLVKNNFPITCIKENKTKIYHLEHKPFKFSLSEDEVKDIEKIKQAVIAGKNMKRIRKAMSFFYKFILNMYDED